MAAARGGRERCRPQRRLGICDKRRKECLVGRIATKACSSSLRLRSSEERGGTLPVLAYRAQAACNFQYALPGRHRSDFIGDRERFEQHLPRGVDASSTDRCHSEIEQREGDAFTIPIVAGERQYVPVERLGLIQSACQARQLPEGVERRRYLVRVAIPARKHQRFLEVFPGFGGHPLAQGYHSKRLQNRRDHRFVVYFSCNRQAVLEISGRIFVASHVIGLPTRSKKRFAPDEAVCLRAWAGKCLGQHSMCELHDQAFPRRPRRRKRRRCR